MLVHTEQIKKGILILLLLPFFGLLTLNCERSSTDSHLPESNTRKYIFLAHTLHWYSNTRLDPKVERLDLSVYDEVWLGGDLVKHSTRHDSTIAYLDSILRISDEHTLWTPGNHDLMYSDVGRFRKASGKDDYYLRQNEELTIVVMNSIVEQMSCEEREKQFRMMDSVINEIQPPRKLIILSHYFIWGCIDEQFMATPGNLNQRWMELVCEDSASTFERHFLPKLEVASARGVEIFCVSGDHGMYTKDFNYVNQAGITFLGPGINNTVNLGETPRFVNNHDPDQVLIFTHKIRENELTWEFVELDSLLPPPVDGGQ